MKKTKQVSILLAWILLVTCVNTPLIFAGNDAYTVTYNHHIEKGELEVMFMNDFTHPSKHLQEEDGQKDYFSNMVELEYAPWDQLASEFMVEWFEELNTGKTGFTGFRYETRYRLFKDEVPLNPMVYAEYEDLDPRSRFKMVTSGWVNPPYMTGDEAKPDRESILETRLILSQDFGHWNVAFNWINETDFHASGKTDFGYALGVSYFLHEKREETDEDDHDAKTNKSDTKGSTQGAHCHAPLEGQAFIRPAALAFELYGGLGDTVRFGVDPARQEHYFQPSVMFHIGKNAMLSLGFAIGLTRSSDQMVRTSLGWEF